MPCLQMQIQKCKCFICPFNGCVMEIRQKVYFGYENVCGLCILLVCAICMGVHV